MIIYTLKYQDNGKARAVLWQWVFKQLIHDKSRGDPRRRLTTVTFTRVFGRQVSS
jgi:hypothetical protein